MTSDQRLLILACSQKKRPDRILLPALERYDGPVFRMLRKFLREYPAKERHPDVYILSAQFGLIPAHQPISNYDCRMTPRRASTFQPRVLGQFRHILQNKQYKELFISVGKDYAAALAGYAQIIPSHTRVTVAIGPRGHKQAELELFLNKIERSSKAQHRCQRHHPQNQLCDCGRHAPQC